jgi:hypothetical protein
MRARVRLLCALTLDTQNNRKRGYGWEEGQRKRVEMGKVNLQKKNLVIKFVYGFVVRLEGVVHF